MRMALISQSNVQSKDVSNEKQSWLLHFIHLTSFFFWGFVLLLAVVIAPFLGIDKKGGFEFIQEYTGFVSPGIFAMFIMGFFWKKTSSNAAMFATIGGFVLSVILKFLPNYINLEFLYSTGFATLVEQEDKAMLYEIPFLDRMGIVFGVCVLLMILISLYDAKKGVKVKGLEVDTAMFKVSNCFAAGALIICGVLVALYSIFW
jgi:SSS family solute:Na+ symporter